MDRLQAMPPAILGHEFAGIIEEVGKDVKTLKPGARVVVPLAQGCGVCEDCRTGHSNHCLGPGRRLWPLYSLLSHADFNYAPLPETVDFVEASSMGCRYVTAFHGILDQGQVKADEIGGGLWMRRSWIVGDSDRFINGRAGNRGGSRRSQTGTGEKSRRCRCHQRQKHSTRLRL